MNVLFAVPSPVSEPFTRLKSSTATDSLNTYLGIKLSTLRTIFVSGLEIQLDENGRHFDEQDSGVGSSGKMLNVDSECSEFISHPI